MHGIVRYTVILLLMLAAKSSEQRVTRATKSQAVSCKRMLCSGSGAPSKACKCVYN